MRVYQVIETDGTERTESLPKKATLHELQRWVGGYIQGVWITRKQYAFVDEEGLMKGLPPNARYPQLVGNVVLCPKGCRT